MIKKILNKIFNKNEDVNTISFKQGMDLTDLPVITLYQGKKKFNLLLDTGSSDNIIDSNIIKNIKHEPIETKSNLFGLEGNKVTVSMCKITLSYMDKDYEYEYLITDMKQAFTEIKQSTGVNLHGIIGSKFFNTYKYVLDFDKLIAYSKK